VADSMGKHWGVRPPSAHWMHLKASENFAANALFLHNIFEKFSGEGAQLPP